MIKGRISGRMRGRAILAGLVLTALVAEKSPEALGTAYQISLPVMALGCAATNGSAGEYLIRYVAQWSVVQGSKHALGETEINARPRGGIHGMPSGHTATAVFGASRLVHECIARQPVIKGLVLLSAGFVGSSRIETGWHDIWQVLTGALIGWGGDRLFRRRLRRWWQARQHSKLTQ